MNITQCQRYSCGEIRSPGEDSRNFEIVGYLDVDDVGVTEGTHQTTLLDELACRPLDFVLGYFGAVLEDFVYFLDGTYPSWKHALLHATVGS